MTEIIADNVEFLGTAGAGDPGPTPPPERRAEPGQPTGRERYSATSPSNLERSGNMPGVAATQSEIAGQPTQQMSFTEVDDSELPF